ncbi:TIGR04255 family protein [Nafulsella turpanensis]|uniref:TIGR04255 family protein n=1 Tax=Nafulsella turpanensis TaxID=1265690 RepID=UPI0003494FFC|nr:TIGR04255 family protein [Nafulsella turpanensis]
MEFINHKVTEAVCAFRFDPKLNNWDITSFADYYNKIKGLPLGFDKKQEIKPMQFNFQFRNNEPSVNQVLEGETKMVFKNKDENYAILLGNNYISFHTLNHYPGWDVFKNDLIAPSLEKYYSLGLGMGLTSAQMIYINNFDISQNEHLHEYLTFLPNMEQFGEGEELSHMFNSTYRISPNKQLQLKTILNVHEPDHIKKVTLECNCIANNIVNEKDWITLSNDAHDHAKEAFFQISSTHFKDKIK